MTTRIDISLDENQCHFLKKEAAARGVSLSAVIRRLIDRQMIARNIEGPRLDDMVGFISSGGLEGVDHDHYLHGWPKRSADRAYLEGFLEREIWSKIPSDQLGRPHDSELDDDILGYGPDGV
jgi:Ribbon-helix-helix protein, copG family.